METKNLIGGILIVSILLFSGCIGEQLETSKTETTIKEGEKTEAGGIPLVDIFNLGVPDGYVVSYDLITTYGGTEIVMKQTHNIKGRKSRIDLEGFVGGQRTETRGYFFPNEGYICTKTQGQWTCFGGKSEEELEEISTSEKSSDVFESEMPNVLYAGIQTIAGVTVQCYKLNYLGEAMKMCVHPDKYLTLLFEAKDYRMTATSVSLTPPADSTFELPAKPIALGELEGIYAPIIT